MKKTVIIFLAIIYVLALNACSEFDLYDEYNTKQVSYEDEHVISMSDALKNLTDYLEDGPSRKDGVSVKNVFPLFSGANKSRSVNNKPLIYIVNFEDNQGYAILSADNRVPETVLGITDSGNYDLIWDSTAPLPDISKHENAFVKGYPAKGDGFFTIPEYGDEILMNPNTVDLYNPAFNDTLVGNFYLDDEDAFDVNENQVCMSSSDVDSLTNFVINQCLAYVSDNMKQMQYYLRLQGNEDFVADDLPGFGGGGGGSASESYTYTYGPWETKKSVSPFLGTYSFWKQKSPFNKYFPERRKYVIFGHKRNVPTGCFPIAVAKTMAFLKFPTNYPLDNSEYKIDWNALQKSYQADDMVESAARLLRNISAHCNAMYFYEGTFCFPEEVKDFLQYCGFKNVKRYNYTNDRVLGMLDKRLPVIVYALHRYNVFNGHAWNIDGYYCKERTVTIKKYSYGNLVETTNCVEYSNMVHCEFGWGEAQSANGYYVSGIFKVDKKHNYDTHIRIIMYDK